jgi:hypothetical protein
MAGEKAGGKAGGHPRTAPGEPVCDRFKAPPRPVQPRFSTVLAASTSKAGYKPALRRVGRRGSVEMRPEGRGEKFALEFDQFQGLIGGA